jgi:hypothetical protein
MTHLGRVSLFKDKVVMHTASLADENIKITYIYEAGSNTQLLKKLKLLDLFLPEIRAGPRRDVEVYFPLPSWDVTDCKSKLAGWSCLEINKTGVIYEGVIADIEWPEILNVRI